ncbi:hypothetical protein F2P56_027251 [Juglans regia]|uniref:DDE Tnp4 domain-containing protein n=2 Tax=Juglans regia TaxID=51240 RepID=A0A833TQ57_JUGRE|nr:uncharacterized protein LOC109018890 [Juglans regia]KAF5452225.1 hypothetical protein F2P56_027251 [Juglans regia]
MHSTSESWARRVPMPHQNIGLRGDQYIQAVLNRNPNELQRDVSNGSACIPAVMGSLRRTVIRPTHNHGVHPYIASNRHNYPWFEKSLGALDGTKILAVTLARLSNTYRNHYNRIAQNVLCLCDFDMKFPFVYTGWEGTTHDARVFLDALSRAQNGFPWPEPGYYYLVDSAFPCIQKFMPPYPRERYYRSDHYGARQFRSYKDYFNFRHSSLPNVIERTFALLKNRFQILEAMPRYSPNKQGMILTTCCTLHNLIKTITLNDEFIQHALGLQFNGQNMPGGEDVGSTEEVVDMSHESAGTMVAQRDGITIPMWENLNGDECVLHIF